MKLGLRENAVRRVIQAFKVRLDCKACRERQARLARWVRRAKSENEEISDLKAWPASREKWVRPVSLARPATEESGEKKATLDLKVWQAYRERQGRQVH